MIIRGEIKRRFRKIEQTPCFKENELPELFKFIESLTPKNNNT
jgi:hypothetical protein